MFSRSYYRVVFLWMRVTPVRKRGDFVGAAQAELALTHSSLAHHKTSFNSVANVRIKTATASYAFINCTANRWNGVKKTPRQKRAKDSRLMQFVVDENQFWMHVGKWWTREHHSDQDALWVSCLHACATSLESSVSCHHVRLLNFVSTRRNIDTLRNLSTTYHLQNVWVNIFVYSASHLVLLDSRQQIRMHTFFGR